MPAAFSTLASTPSRSPRVVADAFAMAEGIRRLDELGFGSLDVNDIIGTGQFGLKVHSFLSQVEPTQGIGRRKTVIVIAKRLATLSGVRLRPRRGLLAASASRYRRPARPSLCASDIDPWSPSRPGRGATLLLALLAKFKLRGCDDSIGWRPRTCHQLS